MGCYRISDLVDLSWAKDLTAVPDFFVHGPCSTRGESESKLFYRPVTEWLLGD